MAALSFASLMTSSAHCARRLKRQAARIRLGGCVSAIRQYFQRALVDEMHLAVTSVLLGSGEHLLSGLDLPALGYELTEHIQGEKATHMVVSKRRD
jgi:dihydrofolate reductase